LSPPGLGKPILLPFLVFI
jgi:hypothetical protein